MAFKPYYNNTKKLMWIGSVKVPAGQTRPVDENLIPNTQAAQVNAPKLNTIFGELNAAKSMVLVKTLDQTQLAAALVEETEDKARKSVIEAVQKSLLALKDENSPANQRVAELEAFAAHWSNETLENIAVHIESDDVKADEGKLDILNAILGDTKND
jgi:hypothetical protein